MKCPKCGYLGFETTDRCRHCGYDFSLAVPNDPASELPLRSASDTESALADFDLDRLIGEPAAPGEPPIASVSPTRSESHEHAPPDEAPPLPLFTRDRSGADDTPLITAPRPPRPPLAVRRATPDVTRRRAPRPIRRADAPDLQLEPAGGSSAPTPAPVSAPEAQSEAETTTPRVRRLAAAVIDAVLLGGINAAVLYLTLAIVGLSLPDVLTLPPVPMIAFLMLLNGGYLVTFTAASGQTIGKMLFNVRVIADDSRRVDVPGAFLRALGVLLTVVTFGIAYLPALLSRDGRALHDRLAGTRVVKHA